MNSVHLRTEGTEILLENKNAVVYGSGGAVGGAVARAFAQLAAYTINS